MAAVELVPDQRISHYTVTDRIGEGELGLSTKLRMTRLGWCWSKKIDPMTNTTPSLRATPPRLRSWGHRRRTRRDRQRGSEHRRPRWQHRQAPFRERKNQGGRKNSKITTELQQFKLGQMCDFGTANRHSQAPVASAMPCSRHHWDA